MLSEIEEDLAGLCIKLAFINAFIAAVFMIFTQETFPTVSPIIWVLVILSMEIIKIAIWNKWRKDLLKLSMKDIKYQIYILIFYCFIVFISVMMCKVLQIKYAKISLIEYMMYGICIQLVTERKYRNLQEKLEEVYPDIGIKYPQILRRDFTRISDKKFGKMVNDAIDQAIKDHKNDEINDSVIDWFAGDMSIFFLMEAVFIGCIFGNLVIEWIK